MFNCSRLDDDDNKENKHDRSSRAAFNAAHNKQTAQHAAVLTKHAHE